MKKTLKRLPLVRETLTTLTTLELGLAAGGGFNPPPSRIDCPSTPAFSACAACTWA
jgi:hypothetical protein